MQYIPILDTLNTLLQNETVLAEVHNDHLDKNGYLQDYCDGKNFQRHTLFSLTKDSLQLLFYYDDVEVCNPLGSKRTIHKLGLFYFTLGNLSPKYRSRLSCIQLVAVVESKFIKKYGMNAVLEPFVKDVSKLEKGCTFHVHGCPQQLFGTVAAVSADNLAANALGGFKEGSTAHRGCRQCMATPEDMVSKFNEEELQLRTLDDHKKHCKDLEGDSYSHYSKEYGVNHRSCLTRLKYFNICSGALVPDVMHDVLEGVLQCETKLVLLYCVNMKKYFQCSFLTHLMESYELGYMEVTSRPTPILRTTLRSGDNSLQQNASQMRLLGGLLPGMIGHFVPEDDEHWQNLMLLLQITDFLLTPRLTPDETEYLQVLIEHHHQTFVHLYPDQSVTPKFHYMVHMPRLIKEFGPLVRHWTMRFEARHRYFKRLAMQLGNFINVAYTLAMRHQRLKCYHNLDSTSIEGEEVEIGPGQQVNPDTITGLTLPVTEDDHVSRSKWVKVYGTLYRKKCAVVVGLVHNVHPQFGEVEEVLVINHGDLYFHVKLFETLYFSEHFHAYVVTTTSEFLTVCHSNLIHHAFPLHVRRITGLTSPSQRALILKHHISTL